MNSNFPQVTVAILNYNGMSVLPETMKALCQLQYPNYEIMVADNGSTDGSREWLKRTYPAVQCLELGENLGSAQGRNILLEKAPTEHVLLMDNDIRVEPDLLNQLMHVMETVPDIGACHPEIHDENDPVVHHYNGGYIHYLGTLIARDKPESKEHRSKYEEFDVMSGQALLINRDVALHMEGFDPDYFFNWEDGDFTARMTLAGYSCVNVPTAVAHHRSKPRGTSKVFYQVRNRWYFMLKLYGWRTLFLIAPMLWIFEILQAIFLLKKGAFADYWRANLAVVKDMPQIMAKRKRFQERKKLSDKHWLTAGQMYIPPQLNQGGLIVRAQKIFYDLCHSYWKVVKGFC